jgi:hypothetical protein
MVKNIFSGKSKRTKIMTVISCASIVVLLGLNLLLSYFGLQKAIYLDMTPEGLYTLSDAMVEECDKMFAEIKEKSGGKKVTVTFCSDPDYLTGSMTSRLTYFMALKLQNRYPDVLKVKTVNATLNPTALAQYKTTSLSKITQSNVIISYGDRYRITNLNNFWATGSNEVRHYNGEYRIATLIQSVTAISQPAAYFVIDHGETYYDPANPTSEMSLKAAELANLLYDRGLEIKVLRLSEVDAIPDDCALLIINNPKTDFTYDESKLNEFGYVSDTEKLDRYLVMKQGAIAIARDYDETRRAPLPVLDNFLYEWGFKFSDSVVVDKEASLEDEKNTATNIIASYDTDSDSYGYAIYGEYADLSSAPLTVFSDTGSVECAFKEGTAVTEPGTGNASKQYATYLTTSDSAQRYMKDPITGEITTIVDGFPGQYDLAALSVRTEIDTFKNEKVYSYLFCVNSPDFFSNKLLGEASYANFDITSAVIENISRVDEHASMDLGGLSLNSSSSGGKRLITMDMSTEDVTVYSNKYKNNDPSKGRIVIKENQGISMTAVTVYTVIVFAVPVALAVVGIVICAKRKYL